MWVSNKIKLRQWKANLIHCEKKPENLGKSTLGIDPGTVVEPLSTILSDWSLFYIIQQ